VFLFLRTKKKKIEKKRKTEMLLSSIGKCNIKQHIPIFKVIPYLIPHNNVLNTLLTNKKFVENWIMQ